MKQTIYGLTAATIVVLGVLASLTLYMRQKRVDEMEAHMSEAVCQTMRMAQKGELKNEEQMIGAVIGTYLQQTDSNGALSVEIVAADAKKGLLDVMLTEQYRYPTGQIGSITKQKAMILDEWQQEEPEEVCSIMYYCTGANGVRQVYKSYQIQKGDRRPQVKEPQQEGRTFLGWHRQGDAREICDEMNGEIETNEVYEAVFS